MSSTPANSRVFGSLDSFDPKAVEWELYETQFDFFLQANGVTDAKQKRALLLSTIGMGALSYVRDLNLPVELNARRHHLRQADRAASKPLRQEDCCARRQKRLHEHPPERRSVSRGVRGCASSSRHPLQVRSRTRHSTPRPIRDRSQELTLSESV